jgi:hypothetical protein
VNYLWIESSLDTFYDEDSLYILMQLFEKGVLKDFWEELTTSGKPIDEEVFFFFYVCFSHHF